MSAVRIQYSLCIGYGAWAGIEFHPEPQWSRIDGIPCALLDCGQYIHTTHSAPQCVCVCVCVCVLLPLQSNKDSKLRLKTGGVREGERSPRKVNPIFLD